jgi:hypothetical protein
MGMTSNNAVHPPSAMRSERLAGSGNGARWVTLPWSLIMVTLAVTYLLEEWSKSRLWSSDVQTLFALGFVILLVPFIARSFWLGIWRTADTVIVKSWFKTVKLPIGTGVRCESVGYRGLLMYGESGMFHMLRFTLNQRRPFVLRGTIALRKSSLNQAKQLDSWLQYGRSGETGEFVLPDTEETRLAPGHRANRLDPEGPNYPTVFQPSWIVPSILICLAVATSVSIHFAPFSRHAVELWVVVSVLAVAALVTAVLLLKGARRGRG